MDHFPIILDGLILQHVGELFFDVGSNAQLRSACRTTYRRSLEDFAFGVVFGNKLGYTGLMPRVDRARPGEQLLPILGDLALRRKDASGLEPELSRDIAEFLNDGFARAEFLEWMARCQMLFDADPQRLWASWAIREVVTSLGEDESLRWPLADPRDYVFAKDPPYVYDAELIAALPESAVDRLVDLSLQYRQNENIHRESLRQFISRAMLTHIVVMFCQQEGVRATYGENVLRIPFATRASVLLSQDESKVTYFRKLLVPHLVTLMLRECRERDPQVLIAHLRYLREEDPHIRRVREFFHDALVLLQSDPRSNKFEKLQRALHQAGTKSTSNESLAAGFTVSPSGVSTAISGAAALLRFFRPQLYALRQVAAPANLNEYEKLLSSVFPELVAQAS
jgi:hypothetical protein